MSESDLSMQETASVLDSLSTERLNLRHILACVNGAASVGAVLSHAAAVSKAVGARITVIHVLGSSVVQQPMDPVEWTQRHCAMATYLHERLSHFSDLAAEVVIVDGSPAERICAWIHDHAVDLVVLGRGRENKRSSGGLGGTARRIVEAANASVLLVPSLQLDGKPIRYSKLLMPLDGSSRSECALPLGLAIADAHDAQIVLVHAAPKFDLIEGDLLNHEAIVLRDQLYRHNEHAARQYLSRLRSRLPSPPITGTRLLTSGDARRVLAHTAMEERADLIVLSAAGKSGHADMAIGSVADYLINHVSIPVLLLRQHRRNQAKTPGEICNAMDIRQPNQRML